VQFVLENTVKLSRASALLGVMTLALIVSPFATADDSGWYIGANAGESTAKIDDPRIINGLLSEGFETTAITNDQDHIGFKLFGGYQIDKYLALESGYFDLGRFGFTADTLPSGALHGNIKLRGANFDVVGLLPLTENFSAFARIGMDYAFAADTFAGAGAVVVPDPDRSRHAANYKFGVGLQYALTPSWGVRAEAERYRVDDAVGHLGDINLFTVGVLYRFGASSPLPPPSLPPPPPPVAIVAAEPAPPPPPLPPPTPPPPTRKRVSFSADSLFDFGKAIVKPAGKQGLDTFAAELRGDQFDVITVTGYTDRLGAPAYNQKLSERRAEAVKSYLVETSGIPAGKITARGADGSEPVTTPETCKGQRRTPELIACLQPDRRVDVEVTGTRLQAAPAQ
jgi:OOP family OmpA-OmpF porin